MAESLPNLPELYYLDNFESLFATVVAQYSDLLLPAELEFVHCFERLGRSARALYVRLVSRRGPLFRPEKLGYPELGELAPLLDELEQGGLLQRHRQPALEHMLGLCRKDELEQLFAELLEPKRGRSRALLLEEISALQLAEPQCGMLWQDWYQDTLIEPRHTATVELFLLLFFGNRRQSLTDFVLSDLGLARYHPYSLDRDYRLFDARRHVEEYLQVAALRECFYLALDAGDQQQIMELIEPLTGTATSRRLQTRWDTLRNRVARQLERYQCGDAALQLYRLSEQHPARERQVRVLYGQGELQQALALCEDMLAQPWCEDELDFTQRQVPLLRKKLGGKASAPARPRYAEERICLPNTGINVEAAVAEYYQADWQHVHYVENTLINALFGLALWDEIFLPLPGAFVNPFQAAPLDMYSREFYRNRRAAIESRLSELRSGDLAALVMRNYDAHQGVSNRWINWRYVDRELVSNALTLIPDQHLLAMWQRILFDPQANRSGLPDLIALDPGRGYCMVEVKGPGDQLQLNQKRWLRFFEREQIPYRVTWVAWQDD